jgi:hypothetical protein
MSRSTAGMSAAQENGSAELESTGIHQLDPRVVLRRGEKRAVRQLAVGGEKTLRRVAVGVAQILPRLTVAKRAARRRDAQSLVFEREPERLLAPDIPALRERRKWVRTLFVKASETQKEPPIPLRSCVALEIVVLTFAAAVQVPFRRLGLAPVQVVVVCRSTAGAMGPSDPGSAAGWSRRPCPRLWGRPRWRCFSPGTCRTSTFRTSWTGRRGRRPCTRRGRAELRAHGCQALFFLALAGALDA